MQIPGSNILSIALKAIKPSDVIYFKYLGRITNEIGNDIPDYESGVTIKGSIQPVKRSVYNQQGLDFQKNYSTLWVKNDLIDISRNVSGDVIEWNNKRYQCESSTPWFNVDGWTEMLLVEIGAALGETGFGVDFGVLGGG